MINLKILSLIWLLSVIALSAKKKETWTPLNLTPETLNETISTNVAVLIKFFRPLCGRCRRFSPVYQEIQRDLSRKQSPIIVAEIDCFQYPQFDIEYEIAQYPLLILYLEGQAYSYSGDLIKDPILKWIQTLSGKLIISINNKTQFEEFREETYLFMAFFGSQNSEKWKEYKTSSVTQTLLPYVQIEDDSLIKELNADVDEIWLYTSFNKDRVKYTDTEVTQDKLDEFIARERQAPVIDLGKDLEGSGKIFVENNLGLILFVDIYRNEFEEKEFKKVADEYRGKDIYFAISAPNDKAIDPVLVSRLLDVGSRSLPALAAMHKQGHEAIKYKFSGKLVYDEIKQFVEDLKAGKIERYIKSQPLPGPSEDALLTAVGLNVNQIIDDPDKDIFIMFMIDSCKECKAFLPDLRTAANKLKTHENFNIYVMDAEHNDILGTSFTKFPDIRLYKRGSKPEYVQYDNDDLELDEIFDFLKENGM